MINPSDATVLLIDHPGGLFNIVQDIPAAAGWKVYAVMDARCSQRASTRFEILVEGDAVKVRA